MCGLVGVLSSDHRFNVSVFKDLMYMSALRGHDSSGMFYVRENSDKALVTGWHKSNQPPWKFIRSRGFWETMRHDGIRLLAGHTRLGTQGSKIVQNAHPFRTDNIIGMHNGTVSNVDIEKDRTDSEALVKLLDKLTLDELYTKLTGAMALVWLNEDKATLNFMRNYARPFCVATNIAKTRMVWASEESMLKFALPRFDSQIYDYIELPALQHWSVDISNIESAPRSVTKSEVKYSKGFFQGARKPYTNPHYDQSEAWDHEIPKKAMGPDWWKERRQLAVEKAAQKASLSSQTSGASTPSSDSASTSPEPIILMPSPQDIKMIEQQSSLPASNASKSSSDVLGLPNVPLNDDTTNILDLQRYKMIREQEQLQYIRDAKAKWYQVRYGQGWVKDTQKYLRLLQYGCCSCGQVIDQPDTEMVYWLSPDTYFCEGCFNDEDTVRKYL